MLRHFKSTLLAALLILVKEWLAKRESDEGNSVLIDRKQHVN